MYGIIYKYTSPENLSYIGLTTKTIEHRLKQHLYAVEIGSLYKFHEAIRKFGIENFTIEILEEDIQSKELLEQSEINYINKFDTYVNGYNMTLGGQTTLGYKHTEEYKKSQSKRMLDNSKERIAKTVQTKRENGYYDTLNCSQMNTKESISKQKATVNKIQENGLTRAQEIGKKSGETKKNQPFITCPHCNLYARKSSNMTRYHFDNCKNKKEKYETQKH